MKKLFAVILSLIVFTSQSAHADTTAFVRYAAPQGEYAILLPEAPRVSTLRAGDADIPSFAPPIKSGILGETATLSHSDAQTGDRFDFHMTTFAADTSFLQSLDNDTITAALAAALDAQLSGQALEKKAVSFSKGSQTLNWGIMTGYTTDARKKPVFNAAHYLVGLNSVTIITLSFSLDNPAYKDLYAAINPSIRYVGK